MTLFGSYRMGDRPQWGRYSLHAVSGLAYSPAHCLFDPGLKAQLLVWWLVARRCVAVPNSMSPVLSIWMIIFIRAPRKPVNVENNNGMFRLQMVWEPTAMWKHVGASQSIVIEHTEAFGEYIPTKLSWNLNMICKKDKRDLHFQVPIFVFTFEETSCRWKLAPTLGVFPYNR